MIILESPIVTVVDGFKVSSMYHCPCCGYIGSFFSSSPKTCPSCMEVLPSIVTLRDSLPYRVSYHREGKR